MAIGAVLGLQRLLVFPAPPLGAQRPQALREAAAESLWLEVDGAHVEAWLLPVASATPVPLAIYAHGNGELIDQQTERMAGLRASGVAVLLVEYPGYGRSTGSPSEGSIAATFVAAFDWASGDPRFDPHRIVGYGRSLGGGALALLAARRPLSALILESTFTSVTDIVRSDGVPDWLVLNRFDTHAVLANYPGPVLILHGTDDTSIPVTHARRNQAVARHSKLLLSHCGHNDCPPQWEAMLSFLAQNGVCRKPDPEVPHDDHC